MDIEINITPRLIERAIFIIVVIGLIISNIYFYNKSCSQGVTVEEESLITGEENKTTTTTTIKKAEKTDTTTTIEEAAENQTSYKYPKATPDKLDGSCISGWKCYKPYYKGFVLANCNWVNVQNCVNGCENGQCKE